MTPYDCTQPIQIEEGLRIRPYTDDDIPDLYPRLLDEQEDLFMIGSIGTMRSIQYLRAEIDRVSRLLVCSERLGGAIERDGRIVGSVRISHIIPGEEGDLGYWLFKEARGRGIVTRCGRALFDIAFSSLSLKSVTILAATQNRASCAVAERLRMTREGVFPGRLHRGGRYYEEPPATGLPEKSGHGRPSTHKKPGAFHEEDARSSVKLRVLYSVLSAAVASGTAGPAASPPS